MPQLPGSEQLGDVLNAETHEDARLLFGVADGDERALAALYRRRGQLLYSLSMRVLGNEAEAREILQDVFLQIWQRAAEYDPRRSSPLAWMTLITRGRAVDRLRMRARRQANHSVYEQEIASLEVEFHCPKQTERDELARACSAALDRLPEGQSRALQLAFFRGWTHEEIASATGEPLGTVKARIRRGLLALRTLLKEFRHD